MPRSITRFGSAASALSRPRLARPCTGGGAASEKTSVAGHRPALATLASRAIARVTARAACVERREVRMFRTVFVKAVLSVGLWVASARAGTPFGGDDIGFIPPDVADAKCEAAAAKLVVKTVKSILKAHNKRAKGHIDPTTEEALEDPNYIGRIAPILGRLFRSGFN